MRDADARRMMLEIATHYEDLAATVDNTVMRQDKPDRDKLLPSAHASLHRAASQFWP
jgi:hypothetical protein